MSSLPLCVRVHVSFVTFVEYLNVIKCVENRSLAARGTSRTSAFIFCKKRIRVIREMHVAVDTHCTLLRGIADSIIAYSLKRLIFHPGVTANFAKPALKSTWLMSRNE